MSLVGCPAQSPPTPVEQPEGATNAAQGASGLPGSSPSGISPEDLSPQGHLEIDIGDVTYGVYAMIEIHQDDITPNMRINRLSSPSFDHRTQLLTLNISPPHPEKLPLAIQFGSTRFLTGHTVVMKVHTYREYTDASGENVVEEILSIDRVIGNDRSVLQPELIPLDAFNGMTALPPTMLVYCELEAWLFLNTNPDDFDPTTANFEGVEYKRYPGFNPARINLLGGGTQE